MKTEYRKVNLKDNVTTAAVLIASLVAIFGTIVDSSDARADYAAVQQMDVLVISASRLWMFAHSAFKVLEAVCVRLLSFSKH